MKIIAIGLMFLFYPQRPESRWFYLTSSKQESYHYDLKTLTKYEHKKVRVWLKSELRPKIKPVPKVYSTKALYEINCVDETLRVTQDIHYGKSGNLIKSLSAQNAQWEIMPPDSIGEILIKTICKVAYTRPPGF
jgi:hypothetical protein